MTYSGEVNSMIQEVVGGGISVSRPDSTTVRLVDNKVVLPRDYTKTVHASSPTTAMELDCYQELLPADQASTVPAVNTAPSDSPPQNHNPAELHMPAPTSSLLGTCEVVPSAATDSAQVLLPCRQGRAKLTSMQSNTTAMADSVVQENLPWEAGENVPPHTTLPCSSSH